MYHKIGVTPEEMLRYRAEGLSNHDIAKLLDISYSTVVRNIGPQEGRMERLAAFKDTPPKKKEPEVHTVPHYEAKAHREWFSIADLDIELNHTTRTMAIGNDLHPICIPFEEVPDLVQFLAWAMRTRMQEETE